MILMQNPVFSVIRPLFFNPSLTSFLNNFYKNILALTMVITKTYSCPLMDLSVHSLQHNAVQIRPHPLLFIASKITLSSPHKSCPKQTKLTWQRHPTQGCSRPAYCLTNSDIIEVYLVLQNDSFK